MPALESLHQDRADEGVVVLGLSTDVGGASQISAFLSERGITHRGRPASRSHRVDKKTREQSETRNHKRLMYIIDPTPQTMEALMRLEISAGVDITMKQD